MSNCEAVDRVVNGALSVASDTGFSCSHSLGEQNDEDDRMM